MLKSTGVHFHYFHDITGENESVELFTHGWDQSSLAIDCSFAKLLKKITNFRVRYTGVNVVVCYFKNFTC